MHEESPISTWLSGPQEPPSDQSTSQPNPLLDKGKAKMQEYEDHFDLDDAFEGLDIHVNEKPRGSTREKNPINCYGYNEYMAYHYTFMIKVASVREPETLSEATKDP